MAVAAREGLSYQDQLDFSGGAFPGMEVIPPNGAEEIVNGVIDGDDSVFRRGPSAYLGTLAAEVAPRRFTNLWSGYLGPVGQVTVVGKVQDTPIMHQRFYTMGPGETDFTALPWSDLMSILPQRIVSYGGMLVMIASQSVSSGGVKVTAWGGYSAAYSTIALTGVTLTNGSKTVTGTGFSALSPGMILNRYSSFGSSVAVIESIQSNTSLTLFEPWPFGDATSVGIDASSTVAMDVALNTLPMNPGQQAYAAVIADRLVYGRGDRVTFTPGGAPLGVGAVDDYHELPQGANVLGMEPLRDQLLVFSTRGVFAISGMAFDLTDAQGNTQQHLEPIAPDLFLWDNLGVASWRGSVIAPCTDDIYLLDSAASMRPIGGGMRRALRGWAAAGYRLGQATVHASHYMLPILDSLGVFVALVVCDLRSGAWTRWSGHAASIRALTNAVGDDVRQPKLYAIGHTGTAPRVLDLSGSLDPDLTGAATDADGSTYDMQITTRTLTWGALIGHTWKRFRARFERAATSPVVSLEYATGKPGSSFTSVSSPQVKSDDNEQIYSWPVREKARAVRFRLTVRSGGSREVLRSFQAGARLSSHHRP